MANSNEKREIREYMAAHGVNYTTAKRALHGGGAATKESAPTGSGAPSPFPFGAITVACGKGREAVFADATSHFTDFTERESGQHSFGSPENQYRHRVDAANQTFDQWSARVRALRRADVLDEIAVPQVDRAPAAAEVAGTLIHLCQTGSAVVVSLDVPDLDSARTFFRDALTETGGVDPATATKWIDSVGFHLLDDALLSSNKERQQAHRQEVAAQESANQRARLNAKEDINGAKQRLSAFNPDYAHTLDRLTAPFVRMRPAKGSPRPTGSYVGGHPYVPASTPAGQTWPHDADGPMVFLCQINFAEVAAVTNGNLPDYPTSGLLQWFAGTGDTYGQTYRTPTAGIDGLHVRWYPANAMTEPTQHDPDAAPPVNGHDHGPLNTARPVKVDFRPAKGLPGTIEVNERHTNAGSQVAAMLDAIETTLDAAPTLHAQLLDGVDTLYGEHDLSDPNAHGAGDRIGGYPALVQSDPRAEHPDRHGTLIAQLDSDSGFFTMWGDGGSAQLFGDPAALATGDTRSLWWSWACH